MKGFFNKLLRIDLDSESSSWTHLPDALLEQTLGGKGLATHLLLTENRPGVLPLSPENIFIIAVGPVTGTKVWSQSRFGVYTKSPATGGYGESYCGGSLAMKIKACGADAVLLKGACQSLKYLYINNGRVEFRDASPIQGADTHTAEKFILNPRKGHAVIR